MAAKTFYFLATVAVTPNWFGNMQDGGTAPTAASSAFGFAPAKTATSSPYYRGRIGATTTNSTALSTSYIAGTSGPAAGTGSGNTTSGDSFVTAVAYTGNFAAGTWTFAWNMRAGTAGCIGHVNMRMWASANASGTSAREITSGSQAGSIITLSTTADTNSAITFNPGAVNLNNEFLFFQVEWQETTAGSSNTDTVLFRNTSTITTPNWTANQFVIPAATDLVDSSPVLDMPTGGYKFPAATALTVGSPVIGTGLQAYPLYASGVWRNSNHITSPEYAGVVAGSPGTFWTGGSQNLSGTGNTFTRNSIATGTWQGHTFVDVHYSGTSGTVPTLVAEYIDALGPASGVTGDWWTLVGFIALVGGSTANMTTSQFALFQGDANHSVSVQSQLGSPALQPFRVDASLTGTAAHLYPLWSMSFNASTAADFTLRTAGWWFAPTADFAATPSPVIGTPLLSDNLPAPTSVAVGSPEFGSRVNELVNTGTPTAFVGGTAGTTTFPTGYGRVGALGLNTPTWNTETRNGLTALDVFFTGTCTGAPGESALLSLPGLNSSAQIPVTAGETHTFSCFVQVVTDDPVLSGKLWLEILNIGGDGVGISPRGTLNISATNSLDWHQYSLSQTPPAGTSTLLIRPEWINAAAGTISSYEVAFALMHCYNTAVLIQPQLIPTTTAAIPMRGITLNITHPVPGTPAMAINLPNATSLTVGSPVIDAGSFINVLTATNYADSSPVLGTPNVTHLLTATSYADSSPVLGTPTGGYVLTAIALTVSSPVLGTPNVTHLLTATSYADSSPVLGTPTGGYNFPAATALTVSSPALGTPIGGYGLLAYSFGGSNTFAPTWTNNNITHTGTTTLNVAETSATGTHFAQYVETARGTGVYKLSFQYQGVGGTGSVPRELRFIVAKSTGAPGIVVVQNDHTNPMGSTAVANLGSLGNVTCVSIGVYDAGSGLWQYDIVFSLSTSTALEYLAFLNNGADPSTSAMSYAGTADGRGYTLNNMSVVPADAAFSTSSPVLGAPVSGYNFTATALTVGSPVLDQPSLVLSGAPAYAVNINVGAPVIDVGAMTILRFLTATSLTVGSPVLDAPTETEVLTAIDYVDSSPVLGAPIQTEVLEAVSYADASPVLDAPAMAVIVHATATSLTVSSPTFGTPAQTEVLVAVDYTDSSPMLGTPAQTELLTAVSYDDTNPVLDVPIMGVIIGATTTDLVVASPSIDAADFHQVYIFTTDGIDATAPSIATIDYHGISHFVTDGLAPAALDLGRPNVTHVLDAFSVASGVPILAAGKLIATALIFPTGIAVASPEFGTPVMHVASVLTAHTFAPTRGIFFGNTVVGAFGKLTPVSLTTEYPHIDNPDFLEIHHLHAQWMILASPHFAPPSVKLVKDIYAADLIVSSPDIDQPGEVQFADAAVNLSVGHIDATMPRLRILNEFTGMPIELPDPILGAPDINPKKRYLYARPPFQVFLATQRLQR